MPVRTPHAARIVGTRMETLNRSASTAPTRRLAITVVLIGRPHVQRTAKRLRELISSTEGRRAPLVVPGPIANLHADKPSQVRAGAVGDPRTIVKKSIPKLI